MLAMIRMKLVLYLRKPTIIPRFVKGLTTVDPAGQNSLQAEVNKLTAAGATSADYGMELAQTALQGSTDRNKVVVFFTDGEPNHGNDFDVEVAAAAINSAKTAENGWC